MKFWEKIKKYFTGRMPAIILKIILVFAFLISLMPIIAWWGGLIGLTYLAYEIYKTGMFHKINIRKIRQSSQEVFQSKLNRIAVYTVLFGILIHGSCRIHSQLLINKLYREAIQEKNIIVTNMEKE